MSEVPSSSPEELTDSIRATRFRVKEIFELISVVLRSPLQNLTSINASDEELHRIVTYSDRENLLASVRKRTVAPTEKIETGSLKLLSAKYEVRIYSRFVKTMVSVAGWLFLFCELLTVGCTYIT